MQAPQVKIRVEYNGQDITRDITNDLEQFTYTDVLEGESDDIQITLNNQDGKWSNEWYPGKKDKLKAWMGYDDLEVMCGTFTNDEIELQGPPDLCTIKALAAAGNTPVRSKKSRNHEGVSMRQLAQKIADENGLTLVDGSEVTRINIDFTKEKVALQSAATTIRTAVQVNSLTNYRNKALPVYTSLKETAESIARKGYPDDARYILGAIAIAAGLVLGGSLPDYNTAKGIVLEFASKLNSIATSLQNKSYSRTKTSALDGIQLDSVIQLQETDLKFLYRIGKEYGIIFSVRDTQLIFTDLFDLAKGDNITIIKRADLKSYSIKDGTAGTFKNVKVSYHNPVKNEVVEYEGDSSQDEVLNYDGLLPNDDTLVVNTKTENQQQAERKGKVALHRANSASREGTITVEGNPLLVAGVKFELVDMGKLSGNYQVTKSTHTITKGGGYETQCDIKCIDKPAAGSGSGSGSGGNGQKGTDPTAVYGKKLNDGIYNARDAARDRLTGKKLIKPKGNAG